MTDESAGRLGRLAYPPPETIAPAKGAWASSLPAMLSWGVITWGAVMTALFAGGGVFVFGGHRRSGTAVLAGVTAALAAVGWNAVLRATHANQFFTDAPIRYFPASWQDFGSGVFALAATTVTLGITLRRTTKAYQLLLPALLCGLAAFLVDVYLY